MRQARDVRVVHESLWFRTRTPRGDFSRNLHLQPELLRIPVGIVGEQERTPVCSVSSQRDRLHAFKAGKVLQDEGDLVSAKGSALCA